MKNIQSIYKKTVWLQFITVVVLFCFSACRNYETEFVYQPINDVGLKDTNIVSTISLKIGDTLRITPQISQSQLNNESNLSFLWTSHEPGDVVNAPKTEISKDRNLKMAIGFPFALGKTYQINYQVLDKTTKVSTYKQYLLTVVNDLVEGWIITEDGAKGADFSMVLPSGRVIHNLFTTINGPVTGKVVRTEITSSLIDDGISPNRRKIYMVTENAATELNYLTFSKTYDFNSLFFKAPEVVKPSYINWFPTSGIGSIINDGKLYINRVGPFPGSKKWAGKLVAQDVGLNYKLAPFVANGTVSFASVIIPTTPQYYQVVVYDQLNKRFFTGLSPITQLISFPETRSTLFDMNNVGMEMLHMDVGGALYVHNVVMKDNLNDYYFLQFRTTFTNSSPSLTLAKNKLTVPNIQNFSSASTSFLSQHMFYSVGNQIYRYEPSSNSSKLQYTFPAEEKVVQVRCVRPLGEAGFNVGVATWNGTEGKFYRFPITLGGPSSNEISSYDASYGGFDKIVDIQYKGR